MQAIILAAGMGKRLKGLTKDNTKCMVKVNGHTIIERMLRILDKKQLSKIVIVIGYKGKELVNFIGTLKIQTPIVFINNSVYDKTNNIYSLSLAKDYLIVEDSLLLESDLVMQESVIDCILEDERPTLALVDKFESWMDGSCMTLDEDDCIVDFIPGKYINFDDKNNYYKTVNVYKFSSHFSENTYVPFLIAYSKAVGNNEYYESVIKLIALLETKEMRGKRLDGQTWYEIDDIQDLDIAESLFSENYNEQYKRISSRFGGFWRYPKLKDYCYLVNPYFPPKRMIQEIQANFEVLSRSYPSGMRVNSLLAGRNFGVSQDYIVVGNGAAELIKAFADMVQGKRWGMIKPTFDEYPHRINDNNIVFFCPENENFTYDENELEKYYESHPVDILLLINPDNPTGNYISYKGLLELADWAKKHGVRLVIDESFSDFADTNEPMSIINDDILNRYDGLYVVKSISKSFGIPGMRLGVLASSDKETIEILKRSVSIWNINAFAEFYMQIYEKYEKQYYESLEKIKKARRKLEKDLNNVRYLRVIPSQANYICCELLDGIKSEDLTGMLMEKNILIKAVSSKVQNGKEYIRVAVRTEEENGNFIDVLKSLKL